MDRSPSTSQDNAFDKEFTSAQGRKRLFKYIEGCNGDGVVIDGILPLINNSKGKITILDLHELRAKGEILTKAVRDQIVFVAAGHEANDMI